MKSVLLIIALAATADAVSYRQVLDLQGQISVQTIQRIDDGAYIPTDRSNRDYKEYLAWVADGNTIAPALPGLTPTQVNDALRSWALTDLLTSKDSKAVLMRAILLVVLDEVNVIRTQLGLQARTAAQFRTAVQNKINSGAAD